MLGNATQPTVGAQSLFQRIDRPERSYMTMVYILSVYQGVQDISVDVLSEYLAGTNPWDICGGGYDPVEEANWLARYRLTQPVEKMDKEMFWQVCYPDTHQDELSDYESMLSQDIEVVSKVYAVLYAHRKIMRTLQKRSDDHAKHALRLMKEKMPLKTADRLFAEAKAKLQLEYRLDGKDNLCTQCFEKIKSQSWLKSACRMRVQCLQERALEKRLSEVKNQAIFYVMLVLGTIGLGGYALISLESKPEIIESPKGFSIWTPVSSMREIFLDIRQNP